MKAYFFEGANGENVVEKEIPPAMRAEAESRRHEMLDALSMFSDELMEAALEDRATPELIRPAIRRGVLALELVPVLMGSAYKNKGVQLLLDAVNSYLPSPADVPIEAVDLDKDAAPVALTSDSTAQTVVYAFKLDEGRYGQLTFTRIYQGSLGKGDTVVNTRTGRKVKIGRLVRIHADQMEDIDRAPAGDIVGLFGIDCHTGDTFVGENGARLAMTSMHVPDPVISLSIKPADNASQNKVSKALQRFSKEDPTFRIHVDEDSNETIISGMGELHLDVYVERMRREYGAEVTTGAPQVAYREAITKRADFNYLHKKQTGGSGQYARIAGYLEPYAEGEYEFVNAIHGGSIPTEYIPSCDKGFRSVDGQGPDDRVPDRRDPRHDQRRRRARGRLLGHGLPGRRAQGVPRGLQEGRAADPRAADEGLGRGAGRVPGRDLPHPPAAPRRRHRLARKTTASPGSTPRCRSPTMFGYSTDLRSATQGKAEFTMEFARYAPVPREVGEELLAKYRGAAAAEDEE